MKRVSAGCRATDLFESVDTCDLCSYPEVCEHSCHQPEAVQPEAEPGVVS